MIPKLYESNGEVLIGSLHNGIKGITTEERNGLFEIEYIYPYFAPHIEKIIRGNIIIADANDKLKNQKFRIYKISKPLSGKVTILARHISYDLLRDYIEKVEIENQSCEYALNSIFRASHFSKHFKGVSDIVNAQNFSIKDIDPLKAIAGTRGSILDTYGTGAELLRDNTTIKVLNKRGHDNGVTIEYKKNLTGFNYTLDETGLITRIRPFAKYNVEGDEITVYSNPKFIDSPKINDYETPFIQAIDFSSHFEEGNTPTPEKLKLLAEKYFIENKCDIPKMNYKIEFVPLSKCAGYEGIEDKIELCDLVTIKNSMYNITTLSKVIKYKYDFLKEKYESMELGEAKTTLGNVVGDKEPGPPGPPGKPGEQGPPGANGNLEDFPDTLPQVPQLTATVLGFASVELRWTYENKLYYNYEVYASKTENFEANVFNLIFSGQASSFLHQVKPSEIWYYKARAVNSHSKFTDFSPQVKVITKKIDNMENYFDKAAIGNAVVEILTAEYMTAGIFKGYWIDARNLSVTDGNGKRTLDIDSYGNVYLDVKDFKISNKQVYTADQSDSAISEAIKGIETNILPNGSFNNGNNGWNKVNVSIPSPVFAYDRYWCNFYASAEEGVCYAENVFDILPNRVYNFSMLLAQYNSSKDFYRVRIETQSKGSSSWFTVKEFTGRTAGTREKFEQLSYSFKSDSNATKCRVWIGKLVGETFDIYVADLFMGTGTVYARKSEFQILDDKISLKVEEGEFGTLLEQNSHAVKIAWNNISNYVQFENGGLSIYNGSVITSQKRAVFNETGNHFWRDGYYVGKIGTNKFQQDTSIKGLNFNLEQQGGYMSWSVAKYAGASNYTMVWTYANKTVGDYAGGKLHAGADIDMHNYTLRNVQFEGGGITGTLVFTQIVGMNTDGTAARWYNNSKLVFQNGILIDATWGNG